MSEEPKKADEPKVEVPPLTTEQKEEVDVWLAWIKATNANVKTILSLVRELEKRVDSLEDVCNNNFAVIAKWNEDFDKRVTAIEQQLKAQEEFYFGETEKTDKKKKDSEHMYS